MQTAESIDEFNATVGSLFGFIHDSEFTLEGRVELLEAELTQRRLAEKQLLTEHDADQAVLRATLEQTTAALVALASRVGSLESATTEVEKAVAEKAVAEMAEKAVEETEEEAEVEEEKAEEEVEPVAKVVRVRVLAEVAEVEAAAGGDAPEEVETDQPESKQEFNVEWVAGTESKLREMEGSISQLLGAPAHPPTDASHHSPAPPTVPPTCSAQDSYQHSCHLTYTYVFSGVPAHL